MPLIRVTGQDDTLIFEGEGDLSLGSDGFRTQTAILRVREGNYHAQVDLTGLRDLIECHAVPAGPVLVVSQDEVLSMPLPEMRTEVQIDIPAGIARSMRRELYAGHPDHQQAAPAFDEVYRQLRGPRTGPTMAELDRMLRQISEAYGVPPVMIGRPNDHADPASPPDWQVLMRDEWDEEFRRREELITSTRAEFPYDPYNYGRVYAPGPSHWTPPANPDEKIRSCP